MRNARHRRRPMAEINVVPYIDVTLVLLVIFMITAPLVQQGVEVDLPKADAQTLSFEDAEPLIVSIDKKGNYYINLGNDERSSVDADTLMQRTAAVLRYRPKTQVMVRGDRDVAYGAVVQLMALLNKAGAGKVGMMSEPYPSR